MVNTLREISQQHCTVQPHQIDYILEAAPLLERLSFTESTHGLWHSIEKLKNADSAAFVNIDAALPEADVTVENDVVQLGILGFKMIVGDDTLRLNYGKGNFSAYLAKKSPKVMTASGMALEKTIANLTKTFAARNGKLFSAGGTGDDVKTVFFLRFVEDEFCGLYDPNAFEQGAFFDTQLLGGGQPYDKDGKTVYGADFKSYIGLMMENPDCVSVITNITDDAPLTDKMIDDALIACKAGSQGTALIVGHPTALKYIYSLKNGFYTTGTSIVTKIKDWDGTEILEDWNFPASGEAMATLTDDGTDKLTLSGEDVKVDGQNFFESQALGAEELTSQVLNLSKGAVNSAIMIKGKVKEALTLTAAVDVTIEHCATKGGTYKTLFVGSLESGAAAGSVFLEYVLPPSFAGYARVKIGAADASAAGTVDIYPVYIPR